LWGDANFSAPPAEAPAVSDEDFLPAFLAGEILGVLDVNLFNIDDLVFAQKLVNTSFLLKEKNFAIPALEREGINHNVSGQGQKRKTGADFFVRSFFQEAIIARRANPEKIVQHNFLLSRTK
jgi:hypothetical protein